MKMISHQKERMVSMDIAALSTAMSQASLATQVQTALVSKAMDITETASQTMIQAMERSVQPHLGGNFDVRV